MTHHLTRRGFVATASAAAFTTLLRAQEPALPETTVHVGSGTGSRVPADVFGLSFPAAALKDVSLFHPENVTLVQQIRLLAPRGLLRIAGGTADVASVDTKVIDNLDSFLRAIGWTCVYGLRTDGAPQAAVEYLSRRLGARLNAFELSVNSDSSPQRALATAKSLQAAVPGIAFTVTADDFAPWVAAPEKPQLRAIATTYTRGNGNVLQPDAGAPVNMAAAAATVGAQSYRIAEASVMQPDIFSAALWSANRSLLWMQQGYASACFRDGVAREDGRSRLTPVGMGMKFAAAFTGATMLPVTVDAVMANVTAYAARRADGKTILALFNMEAETQVRITVPFADTVLVLKAPSLEAREAHVTSIVSETGSHRTTAGQSFTLPPHMAVLLVLR